jgi:hypothetical protein
MKYAKTTSHRARRSLRARLGHIPQNFLSYDTEGEWHELQPGEETKLCGLKGCTVISRVPAGLFKPWKF